MSGDYISKNGCQIAEALGQTNSPKLFKENKSLWCIHKRKVTNSSIYGLIMKSQNFEKLMVLIEESEWRIEEMVGRPDEPKF